MGNTELKSKTNPILFLLAGPLLALGVYSLTTALGINSDIAKVSGLASWMIFWWISEATPMAVTALLPIIVLPILGISPIQEAVIGYSNPVIFLFMGGFMLALALQKHRLHERIALSILKVTGTSGNGIILGFVIATAFLSMWVSNTATAVMMLPIAVSVTQLLKSDAIDEKSYRRFALGLMLSIAYAANIGGFMTLIGTPPNVVMAGYLDNLIQVDLSFAHWLNLGLPVGITLLTAVYLITTRILFPNHLTSITGSDAMIRGKLAELGKLSKPEKYIIGIFMLTIFCWLMKKQINGLLGANLLTDHMTAMAGGLAMFIVPYKMKPDTRILDWEDTRNLPWGILLLFGGGISLAASMQKVGIIDEIGAFVSNYGNINEFVLILLVTTIVLFMTELMSNVALVTIMIPVLIGVAQGMGKDPLLLVIPATIASSCAFMMPISTPPNAIVYASGYIRMRDMLRAGLLLNLVAVLLLSFATYVLVPLIFG